MAEKIDTSFVINTPEGLLKDNDRGCTERIKRLRRISHSTQPHLDLERAKIETDVYKEYEGSVSVPVLRALVLKEYFSRKTLYLGEDELLVGEKGKDPQCSPTFPELCCHTIEDMHIMNDRKLVNFTVTEDDLKLQEEEIIPYWKNRAVREHLLKAMTQEWRDCYEVGMFTEFMDRAIQPAARTSTSRATAITRKRSRRLSKILTTSMIRKLMTKSRSFALWISAAMLSLS
jgi:hypothetical protein